MRVSHRTFTLLWIMASIHCCCLGQVPNLTKTNGLNLPDCRRGISSCIDLNQDGLDEILIGGENGSGNYILDLYSNSGSGNFQFSQGFDGLVDGDAAFGDLNGDSLPDLVIQGRKSYYEPITLVYTNQAGVFVPSASDLPWLCGGTVTMGDFDGDSDLDVFITGYNFSDRFLSYMAWNESGQLEYVRDSTFMEIGLSSVDTADYNLDGRLDLIATGVGEDGEPTLFIYENEGNRQFSKRNPRIGAIEKGTVAFADMDLDGDPDVLVTGLGPSRGTKLYENRSGQYYEVLSTGLLKVSHGIGAWGNFNGDAYPDIVLSGVTDTGDQTIIYSNNGNQTFSVFQAANTLFGFHENRVEVKDFDSDGRDDFLIIGQGPDDLPLSLLFMFNGSTFQYEY